MKRLLAVCLTALCGLVAVASAPAAPGARVPALTPAPLDSLTRAFAQGRITEARYALERARSLFAPGRVRREFGDVATPSPRSATMILRDLAVRVRFLSTDDRAAARGILARPTDTSDPTEHHYSAPPGQRRSACDAVRPLCFHWVLTTRDAPLPTDGDANGIPDDVDATMTTFAAVWDLEVVGYGFLPPLADDSSTNDEGDGRTDIYLADLGGDSTPLFGYCTSDDPNAFDPGYPYFDVSAYCVVDEDFANFGSSQTRKNFRDVTAAHEFFHAIQFHYDWFEDLWLMEGTAMFMEGQFRPAVDDRIQYLANSALKSPSTPVDRGAGGYEYGAWIWWRFLVEKLGELPNPLVIRQVWERVAGASTDTDGAGPDSVSSDLYSLRGAVKVLGDRGLGFRTLFGKFAHVNRIPSSFYTEGSEYPRAPISRRFTLGARGSSSGWHWPRLRHLASTYVAFKPGAATRARAALRITVNLPDKAHGPRAFVLIRSAGQGWRTHEIVLDAAGNGAKRVAFGRGTVREVDLVLTNTSPRMRCERDTFYSCAGVGVDDLLTYSYRATVR
jgi:hypothetical protein